MFLTLGFDWARELSVLKLSVPGQILQGFLLPVSAVLRYEILTFPFALFAPLLMLCSVSCLNERLGNGYGQAPDHCLSEPKVVTSVRHRESEGRCYPRLKSCAFIFTRHQKERRDSSITLGRFY